MKILAIGTHFDDIEIGCGGTLLKYKDKGDEVVFAVLNSDETMTGDPQLRLTEQQRVCAKIRTELVLLNKKDKDDYVVTILDAVKADTIYIPYEKDHHQDHRKTFVLGMAVGRKKAINVLGYITPSSYDYCPNHFENIDLARKMQLVSIHRSQVGRPTNILKRTIVLNKFFGSMINQSAAEGFHIYRTINV